MRTIITTLLIAVLLTGPLAAPMLSYAGVDGPDSPVVVADDPAGDTLLDGIDWDEWFDNLLDGIDWDEWLESLGLKPAVTT